FSLQRLQPLALFAGQARPLALILLRLPHPFPQRLRRAADLRRNRNRSLPIASHDRPHAPAPSEPLAREPPVRTELMTSASPSPHPLKDWSLRETRYGSDIRGRILGHLCLGRARMVHGELVAARSHLQEALDLYRSSLDDPTVVWTFRSAVSR